MIWIRADAGVHMGTGHVMRCLTIAAEAVAGGQRVVFLAADSETEEFLRSRGVGPAPDGIPPAKEIGAGRQRLSPAHPLFGEEPGMFVLSMDTPYDDMEQELPFLQRLLEICHDPILVDSYFITPDYLKALRELAPVAILDEDHRFPYPVDLLINYNIFAADMNYGSDPTEAQSRLLLGPAYACLREQFRDVPYEIRDRVERIFLTTGGGDRYNLTGRLLERFLNSPVLGDREYCVVSGAMNPNYPYLAELADRHPNVRVHRNVSRMAELMKTCDLAVTAAGSTVYELSAVGVPFLGFSFVDNQERIIRRFVADGLVPFGGDYLADGDNMLEKLVAQAECFAEDAESRRSYSEKLRRLVDCRGAERIAQSLEELRGAERIAQSPEELRGAERDRGVGRDRSKTHNPKEPFERTGSRRPVLLPLLISLALFFGFLGMVAASGRRDHPIEAPIVVLGDSIFGEYRKKDGITGMLSDRLGVTVINGALGGTTMAREDALRRMDNLRDGLSMCALSKSMASGDFRVQKLIRSNHQATAYFEDTFDTLSEIHFQKTELFVINHGINDYQTAIPLEDPADPYNEYTYAGALRSTIKQLRKACPKARILLCSPTYSWYLELGTSCEQQDFGGGVLEDYISLEEKVAEELQVEYLDLYHGLYPHDKWEDWSVCTRDGVHPNERGRRLIAEKLIEYLEEHP